LDRDLCNGAFLPISSCCISASRSPCRARLDRPRSAPFACTAHLALFFICLSGSGLVVVASLPSKSCQLLPHQTSSEGWLILASSPFFTERCCPSFSSQTSRKFPGSVGVPGNFAQQWFLLCSVLSLLERKLDHNSSFCRRRRSPARHSSQNSLPLAQTGQSSFGCPPGRCPHQMCDAGGSATGSPLAWPPTSVFCSGRGSLSFFCLLSSA